jgi:hypothetical protein
VGGGLIAALIGCALTLLVSRGAGERAPAAPTVSVAADLDGHYLGTWGEVAIRADPDGRTVRLVYRVGRAVGHAAGLLRTDPGGFVLTGRYRDEAPSGGWFEFQVTNTGGLITLDGRWAAGIRNAESPSEEWKLIRYDRSIPPMWIPELADRAAFPALGDPPDSTSGSGSAAATLTAPG